MLPTRTTNVIITATQTKRINSLKSRTNLVFSSEFITNFQTRNCFLDINLNMFNDKQKLKKIAWSYQERRKMPMTMRINKVVNLFKSLHLCMCKNITTKVNGITLFLSKSKSNFFNFIVICFWCLKLGLYAWKKTMTQQQIQKWQRLDTNMSILFI